MSLHTDFQNLQVLIIDWLLNWDLADRRHVEIIYMQPRQLSAIGVAKGVAEEKVEEIGNTVGYQVMQLILHKTTAVNLNSPECSL
jgi:HrpA-like RNA helicase